GWTPLFAAVWDGHQAAADRLVAAGAETDLVDASGRSLQGMARARGLVVVSSPPSSEMSSR
ncbi:MAG: ankyrin repeat domain-containing protein, partial [Myxococcales bacterium]|nr:ankyrin repeat domain-containing protein [Myxococcales bacterium]